jgi:uncharacterized protein YjeT (DUF2065 family)
MRAPFLATAAIFIAAGLIVVLVGLLGIIDPVGTKLADDADPFGEPSPRWHGFVIVGVGASLVATGAVLLGKSRARKRGAA